MVIFTENSQEEDNMLPYELQSFGSFTDNSPTNQLADNQVANRPTRRQTNWLKLIYGRFGTRRNAVESMKVALPAG